MMHWRRFAARPLSLAIFALALLAGCGGDGDDADGDGPPPPVDVDFRAEMRDLVEDLAAHARATAAGFVVVTQNGQPLITADGRADGTLVADYLAAFDGVGQEGVYYGYDADNVPTDPADRDELLAYLDRLVVAGKQVLATSYCWDHDKIDDALTRSRVRGYLAFAAPARARNVIPDYPAAPHRVHDGDVDALAQARNYLYLSDPGLFASVDDYLAALAATDFDVLVLDAFFGGTILAPAQLAGLGTKQNGGRRLVLAYLPVADAESDRYYWQDAWNDDPPDWLESSDAAWPANTRVRYWEPGWRAILLGSADAYLDRILAAGFDGAYLDGVDTFEYFEERYGN